MVWYLETERLQLRAIDVTDASRLHELNSDRRVMQYLGSEYDTLEGATAVLPKVVARNERYDNQLGLFAAFEKLRGEYIGWFILRPDHRTPDDTRNLEIGYRLKHAHWGKGYGTEASLALVDKARTQFSAHRIYAEAMPDNRASIRIMEKIGLKFDKTFTETESDGSHVELVLYSRTFARMGRLPDESPLCTFGAVFVKIRINKAGAVTEAILAGPIKEGVGDKLEAALKAPLPERIVFDMEGVDYVNSIGVAEWLQFVSTLKGSKIEFRKMPEPMVAYVNMIPGLLAKGAVTSFFAPVSCRSCKRRQRLVVNVVDGDADLPATRCAKCNCPMACEVDWDEYKGFLQP